MFSLEMNTSKVVGSERTTRSKRSQLLCFITILITMAGNLPAQRRPIWGYGVNKAAKAHWYEVHSSHLEL
jgi:hypothetical protein